MRTPKIVILKKDVNATDFAVSTMGCNESDTVDAVAANASTDDSYNPQINDALVQTHDDFGLVVANLTSAETKDWSGSAHVESVEEDEAVFACDVDVDAELPNADVEALDDEDVADLEMGWERDGGDEWEAPSLTELETAATEVPELGLDPDVIEAGVSAFDGLFERREVIERLTQAAALVAQSPNEASPLSWADVSRVLNEVGLPLDGRVGAYARERIIEGVLKTFAPLAWPLTRGSGVRVGVVDTGISTRHDDLRVVGGMSAVPGVSSFRDDHGHGTHVAGIIAARARV